MIDKYKAIIQRKRGQQEILIKQAEELREFLVSLHEKQIATEFLQVAIQKAAMETQQKLILHIEGIVNKIIDTVFPDTYTFKVEFKVAYGKSAARLIFFKDKDEIDLLEASGCGVVDCACIALRLACWSLSDSPNVILLDESMKHLSRDRQPRFAEVLREVTSALGLQIIFVTHSDLIESVADKIHTVSIRNGISSIA